MAQEKTKSTVTSASPTDKVRSATGCWRGEPNLWPARTNSSLKQQGTKTKLRLEFSASFPLFFRNSSCKLTTRCFPVTSHTVAALPRRETLSKQCNSGQQRHQYQNYQVFRICRHKRSDAKWKLQKSVNKSAVRDAANTVGRAKMIVREDATEHGEWAWA